MKLILSLTALLFTATALRAQVVVTNPVSDILSQTLHAEDIAKTVQQINTLTQQLQQIQSYVKALGDPSKLLQITGADSHVSSLKSSGVGQTIGQLQQAASGVAALQYSANGLYRSFGTTVQRSEDLYRNYGAIQQDSKNFQLMTDDVNSRRAALRKQIAEITQQLQSATTDADTQKLTGGASSSRSGSMPNGTRPF